MTQRPIGVFDSGVGGLSVLDALVKALPNEHFVYVGDTAHMPYGERSPDEIRRLVQGIERFLLDECKAKMLVVACNTSAGILADYWRSGCPVPVVEPVLPITDWLGAQGEKTPRTVGLLATQGTVNSGRYQAVLEKRGINVVPVVCTGFAKLVEDNRFDTSEGHALLKTFLEPLAAQGVDAIILGCTHYPFALSLLKTLWEEVNPEKNVEWLDPAQWMATAVQGLAADNGKQSQCGLKTDFYVTGNPDSFDQTAMQLNLKTLRLTKATLLVLPGLIQAPVNFCGPTGV